MYAVNANNIGFYRKTNTSIHILLTAATTNVAAVSYIKNILRLEIINTIIGRYPLKKLSNYCILKAYLLLIGVFLWQMQISPERCDVFASGGVRISD